MKIHAILSASALALAIAGPTSATAVTAQSDAPGVVMATDTGRFEGARDGDVVSFKGIPFAAPPVGALRWRPPQSPPQLTQVTRATEFAAPCMQSPSSRQFSTAKSPSEDCLYLNVWAPAQADPRKKRPVLVWIHGGAFRAGATSDPRIAGDILAARGIIVVTIAYRLGVFGFLSHPQLSNESVHHVSGNYGLLDQLAALRWVRRNIAGFGGDPGKVTIGGMSAGAISTAMLAATPAARGYFRGIISMSGGSFAPPRSSAEAGENMVPLAESERSGIAFARSLGAATVADLRAVPAQRLLSVDGQAVSWPVIDGRVIPGDEYRLFQQRRIADVPLLLGTTSDEGFNFSRIATLDAYRADVTRRYGSHADRIFAAYPARTDADAVRQGRDLLRDVMFGWGTFAWAGLQNRYGRSPVWTYYFDHVAPRDPGTPADAGAMHGSDQPYPFGIDHQPRNWTPRDRELSDQMTGYFVNFVRAGDPNGAGLPIWPRFHTKENSVLHFADNTVIREAPNADKRLAIDAYMQARRVGLSLEAP